MIHVFSKHISPRLTYVLDFCFKEKGCEYEIITDESKWKNLKGHRINYSDLHLDADLDISPNTILFEEDICEEYTLNSNLFLKDKEDPFAAIFYILTRYEEYFTSKRDQHERYISTQSDLVKLGVHKKPVVDLLVKNIWSELALDYSKIKEEFASIPSFDIDIAWAYKNRGLIRNIGAGIKGKDFKKRKNVLSGKEKDPYDTYSYILDLSSKVKNIDCFILLGDWSKYDKNIHWKNTNFQQLILDLSKHCQIGIHPSYNSYLNNNKIDKEIKRLQAITKSKIFKSRQHFLRLKFPESYQSLIASGIKEDFSMGYADNIGFRAGTSFPHHFFDLQKNSTTSLVINPFFYMDSALKDYLSLDINRAKTEVLSLIDEVKNVGGRFSFIWHNSSINDEGEWKGWKSVLEETISQSAKK